MHPVKQGKSDATSQWKREASLPSLFRGRLFCLRTEQVLILCRYLVRLTSIFAFFLFKTDAFSSELPRFGNSYKSEILYQKIEKNIHRSHVHETHCAVFREQMYGDTHHSLIEFANRVNNFRLLTKNGGGGGNCSFVLIGLVSNGFLPEYRK